MKRPARILRNFAAMLSLMMFLFLSFLLVRSYWRADEACYLAPGRGRYLETCRGVFSFYSDHVYIYPRPGEWSYAVHTEPIAQQRIMDTITSRVAAKGAHFDIAGFTYAGSAFDEDVAVMIRFPLWLPILIFGVILFFLIRRRHRDDDATHRCAKCGYDLRATPDRCPECGMIPDHLIQPRH
jgi:hypothetical protein